MWRSAELRLAADHPVAAGHFPAEPIIPGALLLDLVLETIEISETIAGGVTVRAAKFLAPVRHGTPLTLRWRLLDGGVVSFECRLADVPVLAMTGTLEIAA